MQPVSNAARNERSLAVLVPFTVCQTPSDILTKRGHIVRTYHIKGLPFETAARSDIDGDVAALHSFVKSFADHRVGIYQHTIQRKRPAPDLMPSFQNDFARAVYTEYQQGLEKSDLYVVDLYLTIIYRSEDSNDRGLMAAFGNGLMKITSSLDELKQTRQKALDSVIRISREIESTLAAYGPTLLGEHEDEYGSTISDALIFENYLLSGFHEPIHRPRGVPLWDHLGSGSYHAGLDLIRLTRGNETRYAQMLMVKSFGKYSYAGLLDDLYTLNVEYVVCVSYFGMQQHTASNKLLDQISYHNSVGNTIVADEIEQIRVGLDSNDYGVGDLTLTIRVIADTQQQVFEDTAAVMAVLRHRAMNPQTCGLATDAAFFSQTPGNQEYLPRLPMFTTENLCDLAPMHNGYEGKATGNPWGNALMTLKTKNNRVVYLNLHNVESHRDVKGSKPHSATVLLGQTGAGKSTLLNTMNLFMLQFDNSDAPLLSMTLDYKQGARPTIEAMGGVYSQLKNGQRTGYSPFKMDNTADNRIFLEHLVIYLCSMDGSTVTTTDRTDIAHAIRSVMSQPKEDRGFQLLLQNVPADNGSDSLRLRLEPWAADDNHGKVGRHAWALDCPDDSLDFDINNVFGIDGTDLLKNPTVRTPVLMYLLHRVQQVVGTRRVGLFADELLQWLGNDMITDWLIACLTMIRSRDGVVVMATQMPESIVESAAGNAIVRQAATLLFLRDPRATYDVYQKFGMTRPEFKALKELEPYNFIFKQHGTSVTAKADLSMLSDRHRAIISGVSS